LYILRPNVDRSPLVIDNDFKQNQPRPVPPNQIRRGEQMSPKDETKPMTETSAGILNEGEEHFAIETGKKPFLEPTVSVSLNILDATTFFQGSAALDVADL
jgi:hypothetical protein